MKRIFTLILLAGAMLAGSADAQSTTEDKRWVYFGSTDEADFYVDSQTVRRTPDSTTIWQRLTERDGSSYALFRTEIRPGQSRALAIYFYDAKGNLIMDSTDPRPWHESIPGTVQEDIDKFFSPPASRTRL